MRSPIRGLLLLVASAPLLTACFTGERPTLADDELAATDEPAIGPVLELLGRNPTVPFTAHYEITTKFGGIETVAVVAQDPELGRSVTVGDVRYLTGPEGADVRTCDVTTGQCRPGIDESRISDLLLTSAFYSSSPAARLRRDAQINIGTPEASTPVILGRDAACVAVPVTGGTKTYCAIEPGILARMDTADLAIELTSLSDVADVALFGEQGSLPG